VLKLRADYSAKLSYLKGKPKIFLECIENHNYKGAIATLKAMNARERDETPYEVIKFISALCSVYNTDYMW
jgi:hypothetical protein